METRSVALVSARWIARLWSVMSVLFVLAFVIGEMGGGGSRPTAQEWVGLALWPVGVGLGLGVAWYREKLGGFSLWRASLRSTFGTYSDPAGYLAVPSFSWLQPQVFCFSWSDSCLIAIRLTSSK